MARSTLLLIIVAVLVLGGALAYTMQPSTRTTAISTGETTRVEAPGTRVERDRDQTRIQAPGVDITVPRDRTEGDRD